MLAHMIKEMGTNLCEASARYTLFLGVVPSNHNGAGGKLMTSYGLLTWRGTSSLRHSQVKEQDAEGSGASEMKWVLAWQRLWCSSVVEHSPSMHRALDLIPSTTKIIFKKEELEQTKCNAGKILSNLGGLGWPTPATEFCNYTSMLPSNVCAVRAHKEAPTKHPLRDWDLWCHPSALKMHTFIINQTEAC